MSVQQPVKAREKKLDLFSPLLLAFWLGSPPSLLGRYSPTCGWASSTHNKKNKATREREKAIETLHKMVNRCRTNLRVCLWKDKRRNLSKFWLNRNPGQGINLMIFYDRATLLLADTKDKFWHFYRSQIGRILGRIYPSQILIALRRKCWPWWTNFQIGFPLLSPANSVPVSTIQWNLIRSIWVTDDLNFFEWLIGGFGTRSSTLGAILN